MAGGGNEEKEGDKEGEIPLPTKMYHEKNNKIKISNLLPWHLKNRLF